MHTPVLIDDPMRFMSFCGTKTDELLFVLALFDRLLLYTNHSLFRRCCAFLCAPRNRQNSGFVSSTTALPESLLVEFLVEITGFRLTRRMM